MTEISRAVLFGKLNPVGYRAIEGATVFCKLRGNPYVELVHWLHQILQAQDSDLHRLVRHYEIDASRLAADLVAALDKLPRGATAISDFAPQIEDAIERGWVFGTLMFGASQIRIGHLILGILKTPHLRNALNATSPQWQRLNPDTLADQFASVLAASPEASMAAADGGGASTPGEASGAMAPAAMGRQEALARFAVDLTARARDGGIDPVTGRDNEIRQIVDVLMRRRQNNPILTGEAGVGKTAVVEGFALRIAQGDVPPMLRDVSLRMLDVGLLQAGASMKGEFENRLRQVIEEVQSSQQPIILFVDEAHTLIGAGGAAGTGDAANLLKPALARGTLRTIAATTFAEYTRYFEKDPALTRRFQVVQIDEPDEARAVGMMRSIAAPLETHHKVQILDEAIEAAVHLSHRYIPARQLPDKAVSLLDTAAARVAISQHAVPPAVEDCRRRITALETERGIIARETAVGIDGAGRDAKAGTALTQEQATLKTLEARWESERALVGRILALRAKLRAAAVAVDAPAGDNAAAALPNGDTAASLAELRSLQAELAVHQGEHPLILPSVDRQAVASVVGDWTGIPVGRMVRNEAQAVLTLADTLARRVVGQDHGLHMIARRLHTSRAGLDNPSKPVGVFMLCGPSGVGKTETALAIAEALYGGEQNLITINMSEFQEAHTVSTLKGAPPGYVGYGEGGVLTEAVRRKPYSVVLLDEVEKAHSDVHEIFFQVFDKGVMEDGEGRSIDFRNTLILLTSNVGTDLVMSLCRDPELMPDTDEIAKALRQPLLKVFPPALLGRLIVIPYLPLSDAVMADIIRLQLGRIAARVNDAYAVRFSYDDDVVRLIAARCSEPESGGRIIDAILTNTMLPDISGALLGRMLEGSAINRVHVSTAEQAFSYAFD